MNRKLIYTILIVIFLWFQLILISWLVYNDVYGIKSNSDQNDLKQYNLPKDVKNIWPHGNGWVSFDISIRNERKIFLFRSPRNQWDSGSLIQVK